MRVTAGSGQVLALSGAALVPCWCAYLLCCRGTTRGTRGTRGTNAVLVGTIYISLLVVLAAVVCGYIANAALHRDKLKVIP